MASNNSTNISKSDIIAVEDSLGCLNDNEHHPYNRNGAQATLDPNSFISRTSELWLNTNDKMKKFIETRKDLSTSVLDEITPPGNRLAYKSFSSNNHSGVSDAGISAINNIYTLNDVYNNTPLNEHRSEQFIPSHQMRSPSDRPPMDTIQSSAKKNTNVNGYDSAYDMNLISSPSTEALYHDSWPYNYLLGTTNHAYKPTATPPNSIDEHISMLGDSFSKLSTAPNMAVGDSNFYGNFCVKDNILNFPVPTSSVSKLPHPSFVPSINAGANRHLSYNGINDINGEMISKFPVNRNLHDLQHYPSQSMNDLYQFRPLYDFHRIDPQISNGTAVGCSIPNSNKSYISWMGKLAVKNHPDPIYSNKVFLGGLPWDITEQGLYVVFKQFGPCTFEWPGKDNRSTRHPPKGYVYLIFENERSVKTLLQYCHHDEQRTQFYFKLKTHATNNEKSIQIIPWNLANSSYLKCSSERLDITKTVFVGGLHGKITAENLAVVFEELFGHVIYAGIDTDKNKYPIGSGRVTFDNFDSYRNAIQASFVQINGKNFCKKVQIDPYLEDSICQLCSQKNGPFFCKDFECLQYFCKDCWIIKHCNPEKPQMINHRPINRQNSSDIFEILNSIQYYSQLASTTSAASHTPIPPNKPTCNGNSNGVQGYATNNNYCSVNPKQHSCEEVTVNGCKPSDSNPT